MSKSCDCIEASRAKLAEMNTALVVTFNMRGDTYPKLMVEKADKKNRARPAMVIPTFCPFCGVKYVRSEK